MVQIAESSIRHKEDAQFIIPNAPYFDYSMADAHLRLLITLVSCNSTYGPPVVRALWRLITDFDSRWKDWAVTYEDIRWKEGNHHAPPVVKEEEEDEGRWPVPGMSGLSVQFMRDAYRLCHHKEKEATDSDDINSWQVHSDRLPREHVRRLLLAFTNVFRICPLSKQDRWWHCHIIEHY